MEYELALSNTWLELEAATGINNHSVRLLTDKYDIDVRNKSVFSASCNIPATPYLSVLILRYLIKRIKGLVPVAGEWITFKDVPGGDGYYPAFKGRAIKPLIRKYGKSPEALYETVSRLNAKKAEFKDVSIIIDAFDGIPVLIVLQKADEEFGPAADIFFDSSIKYNLNMEEVVVLSEYVASSI